MTNLSLGWSSTRPWIFVAMGAGFLAFSVLDSGEPMAQRIFGGTAGVLAIHFGRQRFSRIHEVVLVLDSSGLRDTRLEPSFLPRSVIADASFEPAYFNGGAIVLLLDETAPRVSVQDPHLHFRGRESSVDGRELKLSLDGLSFKLSEVRMALKSFKELDAA